MKNIILLIITASSLYGIGQIPENWIGHYSGELHTENISGNSNSYHMELIVKPLTDSSYYWTIVYGEDSLRQERKYFLKHEGGNRYVIDEDNSIVLSCNLIKNQFVSVFEVQGNLIHVTYTFKKNKLYFELTSSTSKSATGNTTDSDTSASNSQIPIVYSYSTTAIQKAKLKRIK